jgi:hypothetical protein
MGKVRRTKNDGIGAQRRGSLKCATAVVLPLDSGDVRRTLATGLDRRQGVRGVCARLLEKEKRRRGKERQ